MFSNYYSRNPSNQQLSPSSFSRPLSLPFIPNFLAKTYYLSPKSLVIALSSTTRVTKSTMGDKTKSVSPQAKSLVGSPAKASSPAAQVASSPPAATSPPPAIDESAPLDVDEVSPAGLPNSMCPLFL